MRGRDKFAAAKPLIRVASIIFSVVPRFFLVATWPLLDLFPGSLGLGLRYIYAKRLALHVGDCIFIGRGVEIHSWEKLSMGNNVSIHSNCYIDASGGINIGHDISIAHQCSLVSFNHTWENATIPIRENPTVGSPINIEDDVWIGCGVRVLAGVFVRRRAVVAAGAVVVADVEAGGLYGGVPAKRLRDLS